MNWFSRLNIQGKLFAIFGIIALVGVAVVALNVYSITGIDARNTEVVTRSQKLENTNAAEDVMQAIELAERSYLLGAYQGTPDTKYLDQRDSNSELTRAFIIQAQLDAVTAQEKDQIFKLGTILDNQESTFNDKVNQLEENTQAQVVNLSDEELSQIDSEIDAGWQDIYNQMDVIYTDIQNSQDATEQSTWIYIGITAVIGIVALLAFLLLSLVAAMVIAFQLQQPVLLLADTADGLCKDQYDPAALNGLASRDDEIGQLARAFTRMAEATQKRQADLRQQAAELREKVANLKK